MGIESGHHHRSGLLTEGKGIPAKPAHYFLAGYPDVEGLQ
jgi:hypothetical protein